MTSKTISHSVINLLAGAWKSIFSKKVPSVKTCLLTEFFPVFLHVLHAANRSWTMSTEIYLILVTPCHFKVICANLTTRWGVPQMGKEGVRTGKWDEGIPVRLISIVRMNYFKATPSTYIHTPDPPSLHGWENKHWYSKNFGTSRSLAVFCLLTQPWTKSAWTETAILGHWTALNLM